MKRYFVLSLLLLIGCCVLSSCANQMIFYSETNVSQKYNKNLWFSNDLEVVTADPFILSDDDGYYYLYGTTDALGTAGFHVYRSKQLNYWQLLGPAFIPDAHSWSTSGLWAPEVYKFGDLYYLYYTGSNYTTGSNVKGTSVAVSKTPYGPFKNYEGYNARGEFFTVNNQVFDFGYSCIDSTVFQDDDGKLYYYVVKDQENSVSSIYGYRMIDPVTIDYSSETLLSIPGKSNINKDNFDISWEITTNPSHKWNEAPFMYKSNGKYYLTYSSNPYWSSSYAVGFAIGDSPLGIFTKPTTYKTANMLIGVEIEEQGGDWDFMSGPGHHCFFKSGDELMIGYHAHTDRVYGSSTRAFAMDRVVVDSSGLYVNGPTWSLNRLPKKVSGFENLSLIADINENNRKLSLLKDEKVPMHMFRNSDVNLQEFFEKGTHKIAIEFENKVKIDAIQIYNSLDYETCVHKIDQIEIEGIGVMKNITMNSNYIDDDNKYVRPGGSFITEFQECQTNKITISISEDHEFALSDIVVLGVR